MNVSESALSPLSLERRAPDLSWRQGVQALFLAGLMAVCLMPAPSQAQVSAQSALSQPHQLALPSLPLGQALNRLSQQWGVAIMVDARLVEGKTAPAQQGSLNLRQALDSVLAGTGLTATASGGAITVRAINADVAVLETLRVRANRDDRTEDSGAYNSSRVSLGKGQNIREIPQSVTVITQQRIQDQNLESVGAVMQNTPGVTVQYASAGGLGGSANNFTARGFEMSNVQIDGASIDAFSQSTFDPNLAMYDSVQVLRGADGLYSGNGEPGGTVNLVRKKPTSEFQLKGAAGLGSWQRKDLELDVSGPLAMDGKLRGRAVAAHTDRHFFYDSANSKNTILYGILEADLTPDTLVSIGASVDKTRSKPWRWGLPWGLDGQDVGLPRETALFADWSFYNKTAQEYFAQVEHRWGQDWVAQVKLNHLRVDSDSRVANLEGNVDPRTGLGAKMGSFSNDFYSRKTTLDVNVGGGFELFGRRHKMLLGADWTHIRDTQDTYLSELDPNLPPFNVYDFDPSDVPRPINEWKTRSFPDYGASQNGIYGRLTLSLSDRWTVIAGGRYANYKYESPMVTYNRQGQVTNSSLSRYSQTDIFTPYGGVLFEINDNMTAYGSVAEIYKSQANRLQGPWPGTPLDAIQGRSYEVGVKGEFLDGRLNSSMALYRIERRGEAVRDPAYPNTSIGDLGLNCCWLDEGDILSQGVELEMSGEVLPGWQVAAGYTYNSNRNRNAGNVPYNSMTPRHLFKLWSTYKLPGDLNRWTLGAGVNIQSVTSVEGTVKAYNPSTDRYDGASRSQKISQGGYAVWNGSVQYRISDQWTGTLNINNITDKVYYRALGKWGDNAWYGEPRHVMLTVRGRF